MSSASKVGAVVVAAGSSTRMGGVDKTFAPILGVPLIAHTLHRLQLSPHIDQVVLVLAKGSLEKGRKLVQDSGYTKVTNVCAGGPRRQDSVRFGLDMLSACEWAVIHDGARPCFDDAMLQRGLDAAIKFGAAVAGMPVKDTIKMTQNDLMVSETPDRSLIWAAQTPQIFRFRTLMDAHRASSQDVTDDSVMVENLGHPVKMFLGAYENIKVTTATDLIIAEAFLRASSTSAP